MSHLLAHALEIIDHLIDHCRWHLQPEEWEAFVRRLTSTPIKEGYSVRERWTTIMHLDYHLRKLSVPERQAWLQAQGQTSTEETVP